MGPLVRAGEIEKARKTAISAQPKFWRRIKSAFCYLETKLRARPPFLSDCSAASEIWIASRPTSPFEKGCSPVAIECRKVLCTR
jgi:hypothetical protein